MIHTGSHILRSSSSNITQMVRCFQWNDPMLWGMLAQDWIWFNRLWPVIKKRSRSFLHCWQLSVQIFIWYQLSIYLWVSIDLCSVWIILGHWYTGRYTCLCGIITFMLIKLNQEGLGIWNILIVVFKFGLQLFGDRIDAVRQLCILSVRTCCVWFWLLGGGGRCWYPSYKPSVQCVGNGCVCVRDHVQHTLTDLGEGSEGEMCVS